MREKTLRKDSDGEQNRINKICCRILKMMGLHGEILANIVHFKEKVIRNKCIKR